MSPPTSIYSLPNIEKEPLPFSVSVSPASTALTMTLMSDEHDVERHPARGATAIPSSLYNNTAVNIRAGRPDMAKIISEVVRGAEETDRIAVAACGPDSLMQITRKTVDENIKVDGPSLELFCEQFGW